MNLHDAIAGLNDVFFDTVDGFAEQVTYQPGGSEADQFTIPAVVDWGDEEGSNQNRGDGRSDLNQDRGRSTRTTPTVELPISRQVDHATRVPVVVREDGKDRIIVARHGTSTNVRLSVKRIVGRDEAAQSVLCHFESQHETQTRKTRFG